MKNQPFNILYLHRHDAGRYIQPYGHPVETPHLQDFAKDALLFRKAFCIAPTCGPSRTAMLTGQYPHQVGMYGLPGPQGWTIDDHSKHLVPFLNGLGYETVLAGCQHECDKLDLSPLGYQRMLNTEEPALGMPGLCYPGTIDRVESFFAKRTADAPPFFLSVGINEPHRDNVPYPNLGLTGSSERFASTRYYDPAKLDSRYTAPPPWLPDLPEIRHDMASYNAGVKVMDEHMGRVLNALGQTGLDQSTLVIVTTDHGIEFPGGKKTLSDQGTQVMLLLKGPKDFNIGGGKVIEPIVSQLDIYPTLCELLGQSPKHTLEGESLMPLIRGEAEAVHDYIFTEQTWHGGLEPLRAVRTERYKYILRHADNGPQIRCDGPSSKVMDQHGFFDRPTGHEELYDLYLDPMEACNRIDDPQLAQVKIELSEAITSWMNRSNDCFVSGDFPEPPGRSADLKAREHLCSW